MIKITKIALVSALALCTSVGFSQRKIGHINSNDLLEAMPEKAEVQKNLQDVATQLQTQLTTMQQEYQTKILNYQKDTTATELIMQTRAQELAQLEQRIRDFSSTAEQNYANEEAKLLQPLIDKAKKAITDVANEKGYDYVLDTSMGTVLHMPEGDDMLPMVKKKLSITESATGQ